MNTQWGTLHFYCSIWDTCMRGSRASISMAVYRFYMKLICISTTLEEQPHGSMYQMAFFLSALYLLCTYWSHSVLAHLIIQVRGTFHSNILLCSLLTQSCELLASNGLWLSIIRKIPIINIHQVYNFWLKMSQIQCTANRTAALCSQWSHGLPPYFFLLLSLHYSELSSCTSTSLSPTRLSLQPSSSLSQC